jgi:ABC-type Fe3+/spermidine/putrescine transport system ATPase subunit
MIITLKNISKSFENLPILKDISLELKKGKITTLLGSSGSGKTTILRVIAGLTTPDLGKVYIDDKLASKDKKIIVQPSDRKIGYIFQDLALWPHMSVYENISFGLEVQKADHIKERVLNILDFFNITNLKNRYPNQLSGGQQQLVAIARSLVLNPKILLLDEPLSNLDVKLKTKMQDEILKLKEKFSVTIVYVTHDHREAFVLADEIVVLNDGKIELIGTVEEIQNTKNKFVKDFIEIKI